MIILDTNVISETQAPLPNDQLMSWLDAQDRHTLFITSITVGELQYGVECLPHGRRRKALSEAIQRLIEQRFDGRVLDYSRRAADHYGPAMADARKHGQTVSVSDAMIAGIALAADFHVASRDTTPFLAMGVRTVFDPWTGTTWQRLDDDAAEPTHGSHAYTIVVER